MRALSLIYDQYDKLKMRYYSTLILPRTKEDVLKFLEGRHALDA
jgi:hypothetical protein